MRVDLHNIRGARRLTVTTPFDPAVKNRLKSLPGALWSPRDKFWHYPATPATAGNIDAEFNGQGIWTEEAAGYLAQWNRTQTDGRQLIDRYKSGEKIPLPNHNAPPELWRHQVAGVRFAETAPGCLWYVGLGAGKTLMALTAMDRLQDPGPVLVVCPLAVLPTWSREADTHYPGCFEILPLRGSVKQRTQVLSQAVELNRIMRSKKRLVVVINYESVWREGMDKAVLGTPWSLVVADEVHRIKSAGGKASRFMGRLAERVSQRLGLSGTPCPHSPLDAYGVFRFLDAGVFGTSYVRFRNRYAVMGGYENHEVVGYQREEEFNQRFYSIAFRVDRDVLDLPTENHVYRQLELPPGARKVYRGLEREFIAELESGERLVVSHALARLLRLQQITSGYVPYENDVGEIIGVKRLHTARREALQEVLDELPIDEPVVVFCRFRKDLEDVHAAANDLGRGSLELSGERNQMEEWRQGGAPVLAVQIQSGAEGVDLTRAAVAVYYSLDFSLGRYEQSLRRVHRPGQDRAVTYVHLVAKDTVDESIYGALQSRRDVLEQILSDRQQSKVH